MAKRVCILIPSYNEARTIGGIVSDLNKKGLAVYVIDDGSADGTSGIAEKEGAVVIRHDVNKGKGASIREGLRHIAQQPFDAVIIMDADGQHRVEDIDTFIRKADESGADMVVGNRMSDVSSMPPIRIHTNRFMSGLISKMSGQYVPDTQCGFRYIKRAVLDNIKLSSSNFEIESEMILKAAKAGFRINSVPIKTVYENERSRINPLIDTARFIMFIVKMSFLK